MKETSLDRIVSSLADAPKPVAALSREAGIGWKTCLRYLTSLKRLGVVAELRTSKERIFYLQNFGRSRLVTIPRPKVGLTFELVPESGPDSRKIEDLR